MGAATVPLRDSERAGRVLKQNDAFVMRTGPTRPRLVALPRNRIAPDRRVARLRVADLEIDALHQRIRQGTRDVELSPVEHILLYTLATTADAVVSFGELADALGRTDPQFRNALARHICSLRRKLRDSAERPRYIETVRGMGYRLLDAHAM